MTTIRLEDLKEKRPPTPAEIARAQATVTKAVSAIVLDDPFYGYMLLRREVEVDTKIPAVSTDGTTIRFNPSYINELTIGQVKGVFKHTVMHIVGKHHLRRQNRDKAKWNKAADHVVNALLQEEGVDLPPNAIVDKKHADSSPEHVYNMLPDEPESPKKGSKGQQPEGGDGNNSDNDQSWNVGDVEDAPNSHDPSTRQQLEDDVNLDIMQAAQAAKMMGKLPASMERFIKEIEESKLPWKQILARFFRSTAKTDYSWMRPNRRFLASGIYLPSLHGEALGPLVIGVDTSGSVGGPELEEFFGVINAILKQTKPEAVHVIYCDARVANVQVFKADEYPISLKKFKPKGGGGTAFEPVFDYVTEKKLRPVALLYLTDMYGSFPAKAPNYPTIWCATSNVKAPWGRTLEIK